VTTATCPGKSVAVVTARAYDREDGEVLGRRP